MVVIHVCDECKENIKPENIDRFLLTEIVDVDGGFSRKRDNYEFCSLKCLNNSTFASIDRSDVRYNFTVYR